jgi:hypothetical protein
MSSKNRPERVQAESGTRGGIVELREDRCQEAGLRVVVVRGRAVWG